MKFQKYLEQVLGNKGTISVLRTMVDYRKKVFTIRSLARQTEISHNEAALIIDDLKKFGLVKVQPVGRAHQLSINEKNYVIRKIVEPAFKAEKNTLGELVQVLTKHLDNKKIISAAVFGSVSRGKETRESDIDLLIISNHFDEANLAVSKAAEEVFEVFHSKISPVIFSQKQFLLKKKGDLSRSILDNHILVCGKQLERIRK